MLAKLENHSARIGIVGLGYVGLPLAMEFCRKGFRVTGFEVNPARARDLSRGRSYVEDVPSRELSRWIRKGRFAAFSGFDEISRQDVLIVCVQTPLRKTKEPDLSNVIAAVRQIAGRLKRGQLVVLESTTYPGVTDEVILPILEGSGLRLGKDFFLAFSPERVDPGNPTWTIANTPKVVGGSDEASLRRARALYSCIVNRVVPVSSTRVAETVKLLENTFRSVNIALANEMAQLCHPLGLDVWEIIEAASTKPFGFMPFRPGPGIGGHCIPKDPRLLSWKAKTLHLKPRFIELASTVNSAMPHYAARRIAEALKTQRRSLRRSRILVLGVAYKPGVADCRESPSVDVMALLVRAGARVSFHDPFVASVEINGRHLDCTPLTGHALKGADCVAILTAHHALDYARVVRLSRLVFDARHATRGLSSSKIVRL